MQVAHREPIPSALVIAHPGHELFVSAWLRKAQPRVFALTDGSGRSGVARIETTKRLLGSVGATAGAIFGRFNDKALYDHVLNGKTALFVGLAEELATAWVREGVRFVAGDSYERKFLAHDVCRLVIGAAVEMAMKRGGQRILNYDFPLYGYHGIERRTLQGEMLRFELSEELFQWKIQAARSYPDPSLQEEIDRIVAEKGIEAFKFESLHPVSDRMDWEDAEKDPPLYERHGEKLVAEGHYDRAILYREHVLPIAKALLRAVER